MPFWPLLIERRTKKQWQEDNINGVTIVPYGNEGYSKITVATNATLETQVFTLEPPIFSVVEYPIVLDWQATPVANIEFQILTSSDGQHFNIVKSFYNDNAGLGPGSTVIKGLNKEGYFKVKINIITQTEVAIDYWSLSSSALRFFTTLKGVSITKGIDFSNTNRKLRNQRYRGPKESLKYNNDVTETYIDLKSIATVVNNSEEILIKLNKNKEVKQLNTLEEMTKEVGYSEFQDFYSWKGYKDIINKLNKYILKAKQRNQEIKDSWEL